MKDKESRLKSRVVSVILVVFLFLILKAFLDNFWRLKKALTVLKEKESTVVNLKSENEDIKRRIEELSSDLYIERQLRDNLGMAKEGETVVVLPDDEELKNLVADLKQSQPAVEKPVWQQWLEVFRF